MIKTGKDFINNIEHKPNFQVNTVDGRTYWISRSVAVLAAVVAKTDNGYYILINKRGEGCPDFVGYWNIPCGYLDWGETCQEACTREVFEECGVKMSPEEFKLHRVNSSPSENRQNVTVRHIAVVDQDVMLQNMNSSNSEKNEVSDIRWVKLEDCRNYKFAFNHDKLIEDIHNYLLYN